MKSSPPLLLLFSFCSRTRCRTNGSREVPTKLGNVLLTLNVEHPCLQHHLSSDVKKNQFLIFRKSSFRYIFISLAQKKRWVDGSGNPEEGEGRQLTELGGARSGTARDGLLLLFIYVLFGRHPTRVPRPLGSSPTGSVRTDPLPP